MKTLAASSSGTISRLDAAFGATIKADLDANGWARLPRILDSSDCAEFVKNYDQSDIYRKQIIMARHGFGRGEYKYFSYPLPELIQSIRETAYPHLMPIANEWNEVLKSEIRFPKTHSEFVERCHRDGQTRPTPLILKYEEGDYNCLHQDLYGENVFPLQMVFLLSEPGKDFEGGEFVLTEQRPRMQSKVQVVPMNQGDAVIFAVHNRPTLGTRGAYRVNMRHGVSKLTRGRRFAMGVIFHDAQ